MLQIALEPNNQLTLPDVIMQKANIRQNDKFYIHYENNEIKLIKIETPNSSIMDFLGCAKGVYGKTTQEIDNYLENERQSWES